MISLVGSRECATNRIMNMFVCPKTLHLVSPRDLSVLSGNSECDGFASYLPIQEVPKPLPKAHGESVGDESEENSEETIPDETISEDKTISAYDFMLLQLKGYNSLPITDRVVWISDVWRQQIDQMYRYYEVEIAVSTQDQNVNVIQVPFNQCPVAILLQTVRFLSGVIVNLNAIQQYSIFIEAKLCRVTHS